MKIGWLSILSVWSVFQIVCGQQATYPRLDFPSPKEHLGAEINTSYTETKPVISGDGKTLYFCRQNYPDNIRGKQDDQDIYVTYYHDGNWSKAANIGWPLNDPHPNGVSSVSPDGNSLLLINEYLKGGYIKKGVSITHKTANGWSFPEKIDIEDFYNFSPYVDYFLSSGGNFLFLSVQRKGGYGDQDIYVSIRSQGKWGKPLNLGPVINTAGADFAPFLAADGKTLYFASEGHGGFGGSDIFFSKRLDTTWEHWSTPVNLGPAVNTKTWDAYYSIAARGDYAYFVSRNPDNESRDIYRIALPREAQPDPVVMIRGAVRDANTRRPLPALIECTAKSSGTELGTTRSDPKTGTYGLTLPEGSYQFQAIAPGYLSLCIFVELQDIKNYQEQTEDLYLVPLARGQKIPISNIFFVRTKASLLEESYRHLDRLVRTLKEHPTLEIELGGHTDNMGQPQLNFELSLQRVATVKQYLVDQGIAPERLHTKGYGDTRPIADNDSELNRRRNRRVEFTILKL